MKVLSPEKTVLEEPELINLIVVWGNVSFHHSVLGRGQLCTLLNGVPPTILPSCCHLLFSHQAYCKAYDRNPHEQATLLQATEEARQDITADANRVVPPCKKLLFLACMTTGNILCDVDGDVWPGRNQRLDAE